MDATDAELLRRYTEQGDQRAFAVVVERHMTAVYSAALRRVGGDAHRARDVAQDVFTTLAQEAHRLAGHPTLAGWLHTATRNAAINVLRQETRRARREAKVQAMNEILEAPDNAPNWRDLSAALDPAIDRLAAADRLAVVLRFFEQRSYGEVATALRVGEDAARMRVDRALDKLRRMLARQGITSSSAALNAVLVREGISPAPTELTERVVEHALQARALGGSSAATLGFATLAAGVALVATIGGGIVTAVVTHRQAAELAHAAAVERRAIDALENARPIRREKLVSKADGPPAATSRRDEVVPAKAKSSPETAVPVGSSPPGIRPLGGGRRALINALYGPLYAASGFSPAEVDAFERLRVQTGTDALWVYDNPASDANQMEPLSPAELEQRLRAVLGPARLAEFQAYERTVPARALVTEMASALYLEEPLSREAAERLADIVARASPSYSAGGTVNRADIDWSAVRTAAAGWLSPRQLAALGVVRQQDEFRRALMESLGATSLATTKGD